MKWNTWKGEVAPVFIEHSNGYSYKIAGYMNVNTKEYYSKEAVQEILRISAEQKRL